MRKREQEGREAKTRGSEHSCIHPPTLKSKRCYGHLLLQYQQALLMMTQSLLNIIGYNRLMFLLTLVDIWKERRIIIFCKQNPSQTEAAY